MKKKMTLLIIIIFTCVGTNAYSDNLPINGFVEFASGARVVNDRNETNEILLSEARFQMDINGSADKAEFQFKSDFVYDDIKNETKINIREAYAMIYPSDILEIKVGRQILTWGTGDYLFINDLFPKNWRSFFIGRDDEYLKSPSNTIKLSIYPEVFNVDMTWTPVFSSDTFVTGERISYFNTQIGTKAGDKAIIKTRKPDKDIKNSEWGLRISKNLKGIELSFYGYKGFYKRPLGYDQTAEANIFSELAVYGASTRGQLFGGIGNVEAGFFDSFDDRGGDDPFIENSNLKGLIGYSKELFYDFTLGVQYYTEYLLNYSKYKNSFIGNQIFIKDEIRHLITLRLNKELLMQTLRLSLFTFYSPSDQDAYLKPSISYKWTDQVSLAVGGNIFFGNKRHTFFRQLYDNTNVFARIRYGF